MKTQISVLISKAAASLILLIISTSVLMPFNVAADTINTNNIKGINTVLLSKTQSNSVQNQFWYTYESTITLDADYIGMINLTVNLTYYMPSGSSSTQGVQTLSNKSYFVNGNTIKVNQIVTSDNYANNGPLVSSSYQLNSSNVIKADTVSDLQQVIDLLTDIYNSQDQVEGLLSNQLTQLQQVVSNTSLADTYLETLTKLRHYNFPIESFSAIYPYFLRNYTLVDIGNNSYYQYPIFKLNAGDTLYLSTIWNNRTADFYFYIDKDLYPANLDQYFEISQGEMTVTNMPSYTFNTVGWGYMTYNHIHILNNTGAPNRCEITAKQTVNVIPIFAYRHESYKVSTDFALLYGFSNQLLDDIHVIAQGTSASNQQSSDLSSGTDSMQDQMDDLVGIEDSYNQQFNNSVNSIDFSNPLQQNQGLLGASNFVITVFNGLIANNPFSILIIIVCILLIGKKVIGK